MVTNFTAGVPDYLCTPLLSLNSVNMLVCLIMATVTVKFSGGTNGNILVMEASDFIGNDNGAGNRTGIQAFLDSDMVSVIAVPGVTDQKVQLSLTAHCE